MTTSLTRVEGASERDLVEISEVMHAFIRDKSEANLQRITAKLADKPGVLRRLFPSAYEREQQRITVQEMRKLAASEENLLDLYTSVQMEIARKKGDALIASASVHLQQSLSAYALAQIEALTDRVRDSRRSFLARHADHEDEVESYRSHPKLYESAVKSLDAEREMYFDTIAKLLAGFIDAMSSRVSRG